MSPPSTEAQDTQESGEDVESDGSLAENRALARLLDDTATLLEGQNANPFRVRAYRLAANEIEQLERPLRGIWKSEGREGLTSIAHIGESLSRAIETWLATGTLGIHSRLRGEAEAESILMSVPGIGRDLARRIHDELGVANLEDLEQAAHDGRLAELRGIGARRLQSIRDQLATRLRRRRQVVRERSPTANAGASERPGVGEILEVDREYRKRATEGSLPRIAPRRFNPERRAWLPVLHAERGGRHYSALYSNTELAHKLGRTNDWVVVYLDDGVGERQWTVVTEQRGALRGRRVVRGREAECRAWYDENAQATRSDGEDEAGTDGGGPR